MRERSDSIFLATLAQNSISDLPENSYRKIVFEKCIKTALDSRQYAQCLLPLMHRRLRRQKVAKKIRTKKILRDSPVQQEENIPVVTKPGKWSDMVLPAVGEHPTVAQHKININLPNLLTDLVKSLKNMTGPWGKMPNLDVDLKLINKTKINQYHQLIDNIMKAPLFLMKDSVNRSNDKKSTDQPLMNKKATLPLPEDHMNILSPRLLSIGPRNRETDGRSEKPSFLSPDFLSLFNSPDSIASIPQLLSNLPLEQQSPWFNFLSEVTGTADYVRLVESEKFRKLLDLAIVQWYDNRTVPYKNLFESKNTYYTVGEIFQSLSKSQMDDINGRGFSYLDEIQMKRVYGDR